MRVFAAVFLISVGGFAQAKALTGDWGGEHVSLQLTATGGTLEFDCAHGEIGAAITPDSKGVFDVAGTYTPEHGGPVRSDEKSSTTKVRYAGRVTGDRVTLAITRAGAKAPIGTFTLERGKEPMLMKCR